QEPSLNQFIQFGYSLCLFLIQKKKTTSQDIIKQQPVSNGLLYNIIRQTVLFSVMSMGFT
ncbi:MAG: hypothetical protein II521_04320, partial [Prevotella sp.]|nr:hypothetical protein [Prevotella sp.]